MTSEPKSTGILSNLSLPRVQQALSRINLPDYTIFTILSILTGLAAGLAAVVFHKTIDLFSYLFLTWGAGKLTALGAGLTLVLPAIGMLIQSLMRSLAPEVARKGGVLEVIKSVAIRGGEIPLRTTLFHFFAPAICMGSGGTVGPEGPSAQIGAGVASKAGRIFGLSDSRRRMFTAAGSGAAIAAVFNTPLGGVFFALEIVLLNDFQTATFSALILASVSASAISRMLLGNQPAFQFDSVVVGAYDQFYLFALLGVGAGILSLIYIRYTEKLHDLFGRRPLARIPQWVAMVGVGLILGICSLFYRDILGIGYAAINQILANGMAWKAVLILLLMKLILAPLILESGGFGGIFAPSLFIGACFGFLFAFGLNQALGLGLNQTTYVLVAMGAVLAGINSIPIAAILIIFEMTREYAFILPLMLGVVTSTTLVQLVVKDSIHGKRLKQQGFRISHGKELNVLRKMQVSQVMRPDVTIIGEGTPLRDLIRQYMESQNSTLYVVDDARQFVGTISSGDIRPIITGYENLQDVLVAGDLAREKSVTVAETDDLDTVMSLFGHHDDEEFPVVAETDPRTITGSIRRQDVILAYNKESIKYDISEGLLRSLKTLKRTQSVRVAPGYSILERKVPKAFSGKSLGELRLRNQYELDVLMILPAQSSLVTEESEVMVPNADSVLAEEDSFVLFGRDESISVAEKWQ